MKLIKCDNNIHYFDSDKFDSCPHCANLMANTDTPDPLGQNQNQIETAIPEGSKKKPRRKPEQGRVTGWLVCIEGEMKGESFSLYEGMNHIGRAANMDVSLFKEPTISREHHALLVYHTNSNTFSLSVGTDLDASIMYNGTKLEKDTICTLSAHDVLDLGDCKLMFMPFCDEHFQWRK